MERFTPVGWSPLLSVAAVVVLSVWLCVSGCSKKSEPETVPETPDILSERIGQKSAPETVSETAPETVDTLSEIHDTSSSASVAYGTLTDTRDGKTYKTVKIGKQTWMAENLNYKPETGDSWCYNDSDSYCEKYGRLYDWETAETACPAGWHLPFRREWDRLGRAVGGESRNNTDDVGYIYWHGAAKKLKAKNGWGWNKDDNVSGNGTDDYGFSALPGGERYRQYKSNSKDSLESGFSSAGSWGNWWTGTTHEGYYDVYDVYHKSMHENDDLSGAVITTDYGYSVRCIKNGKLMSIYLFLYPDGIRMIM
jgi:uncharacterized protein (TIGR02145 family)